MKKTVFSLLLITIILFCSCSRNIKNNTTTQTADNTTTSEVSTTSAKPFYTQEIKTEMSDPYSSLIKEMCDNIMECWNSTIPEYKEKGLENYIKRFDDLFYFLYDLDKDGTNELLLGTIQKVGTDFEDINAPEKICISSLYTVKNGKAVKVDNGVWMNYIIIMERILYSNGVIVTKWGKEIKPCYSAAAFENGEMNMKCYILYDDTGIDGDFLKVTNFDTMKTVKIKNDEYYSIYNQYCGNAKVVDIDWKRIDEYSVK